MKKFTLLILVMLLGITGVNAKSRTTTLWEGSSSADAEIHLESSEFTNAESGDVIRITFSFTSAGSMHLCYKTGTGGDWSAKAFNGISEWPYFSDTSVSSAEFSVNATDLTTLQSYGMYIYGFESSTITKIELIHTCQPTSTGDNLLTEGWVSSKKTAKILNAVSDARIGDVLQFTVSTTAAWDWVQFKLTDKDGNVGQFTGEGSEPQGNNGDTSFTLEFIISNLNDLKKIKNDGFGVIQTGDKAFTMTAVNLLTYSDSYGYITITIPEVGYATWSSDKKYDFKSAGLQAYYASDVTPGSVTLTPMDITWDWQGYIIKGSKRDYDVLESLTTDGSYYPSTNYLKCNINSAEVYNSEKNRYIFAMKNDDPSSFGFYKLTSSHTLAAHKAYLEIPSGVSSGARVALRFSDITDIQNVAVKEKKFEENAYYNLSGQRIAKPSKGIYIKNGKKFVIE